MLFYDLLYAMRILHIFQFSPWFKSRIYPVFLGLKGLGHEMTVIGTGTRLIGTRTIMEDGFTYIETPSLLPGKLRNGWCLYDALSRIRALKGQEAGFDIVHGFDHRPSVVYPLLYLKRKNPKLPIITDWNDWWGRGGLVIDNRPFGWAYTFGLIETYYEEGFRKCFDGITTISTSLRDRAISLGIDKERVEYIPGAALCNHYKPQDRLRHRKRFNLPEDRIILGWSGFGSLGVETIYKSLQILDRKGIDYAFLLAGKTKPSWRKYGLNQSKVFDFGPTDWEVLPDLLSTVDIFLLPYPNRIANLGRWPNKLGDYISLARPYVTNPVGDVKEFTEKHSCGIIAGEDPEEFAQGIIDLMTSMELREEMGNRGRIAAERDISPQVIAKRLEGFYEKMIRLKVGIE